ncbi:alpha/beta fold hydrolase [Streptomyces sp. NPDC047315]|uniref:esterase/lipase family protein n=1 Tax=Streptomyces sp. NPDC047315 TaxID=3155142 RepID=UPI00340245E8
MLSVRWRTLGAVFAALVSLVVLSPQSHATAGDPPLTIPQATLDAALSCPTTYPDTTREPVLLLHGTGTNAEENWGWNYTPALRDRGYDVCTVDLPLWALGDIQDATQYVVNAIQHIHTATGRKVDVIGHSQGNLEMRWAAKWWPSVQNAVDDMVLVGNPGHGIIAESVVCVLPCATAGTQFSAGSNFLEALNGGDETPGPITYTSIYSRGDAVVQPFTTAIQEGATNIAVQDICPGRVVGHIGLLFDSVTFRLVEDALTHTGPANPARLPFGTCLDVNMPGVTPAEATYGLTVAGPTALTRLATFGPFSWTEPPLKDYVQ